jgi:short-subunit dehydrogenase
MRKQGGGMIMNVSSGTALMHLPNMSPYSSLKRALADITLTARAELADDKIICSVFYPYMTATAFEDNTIKDASIEDEDGDEGDNGLPPLDSAEYAAAKILECIRSEEAECYAHDWMKGMR